jgi:hypothetical protein
LPKKDVKLSFHKTVKYDNKINGELEGLERKLGEKAPELFRHGISELYNGVFNSKKESSVFETRIKDEFKLIATSQKELFKAISAISAVQNIQQAQSEEVIEVLTAVRKINADIKTNSEALTAIQRAMRNITPNQEDGITWRGVFGFILLKLFGGKRAIITLSILVIAFITVKIFKKEIVLFLGEKILQLLK